MHRCNNADSAGSGVGAFDPSIAIYRDQLLGSFNATQLRHQEVNAFQEEIANVIRSTGVALNTDAETPAQMVQLNTAIDAKDTAVAAAAAADATSKVDGHYFYQSIPAGSVTASPTPIWEQTPTRATQVWKHGKLSERFAVVSCGFMFCNRNNLNYLIIPLPTGFWPAGLFLLDNVAVKVACIKLTSGPTYTDIEGIYARPKRNSSPAEGFIYIGNKELVGGELPASVSFPLLDVNERYMIGFNMNYPCQSGT